jgi:hypothetical protein
MLTLERPDEFAELVLAFLREVEAAPRRRRRVTAAP